MLTTTASYLSISNNMRRSQATAAADPTVKNATAYYLANIGKVTSISDFVNNYQLFSYAMKAFGLSDMTYAKGMITKLLQGGITDSKSLANTMSDPRFKAFATAFDFAGKGAAAIVSATATTTDLTAKYIQSAVEDNAGKSNEGVKLALYFKRVAPTVTSAYGILADSALLKVIQTTYGISSSSKAADIDVQAKTISKYLDVKDLQDSAKVEKLVERFTASWDLSNPSNTLTVASILASPSTSIGTDLLTSIQGLRQGGN